MSMTTIGTTSVIQGPHTVGSTGRNIVATAAVSIDIHSELVELMAGGTALLRCTPSGVTVTALHEVALDSGDVPASGDPLNTAALDTLTIRGDTVRFVGVTACELAYAGQTGVKVAAGGVQLRGEVQEA